MQIKVYQHALEMEKDWEMMSEFDKDEIIRKKIIRELWLQRSLFNFVYEVHKNFFDDNGLSWWVFQKFFAILFSEN